jgi:hypothetical protein
MSKINRSRIDEDDNDDKDKQEHGYKPNEELNQQDKKFHYLLEAINGLVQLQDRQRENFIQKPKEKSMNPNLPQFHGKINEDVSKWFFTLEQNFNACDIDDKRKVSLAHQYHRDSAAAEYRAINAFNLTYKQFKEAMV